MGVEIQDPGDSTGGHSMNTPRLAEALLWLTMPFSSWNAKEAAFGILFGIAGLCYLISYFLGALSN